jgi:hypothetical protein
VCKDAGHSWIYIHYNPGPCGSKERAGQSYANFRGGSRTLEGSMVFKFPFLLTNRKFVSLFNDSSTTQGCERQ